MTYTVMVRATDPAGIPGVEDAELANSGTVKVTITVNDVNEAPVIDGSATASFQEVNGNIVTALGTYTAMDPDAAPPAHTWSVDGADEQQVQHRQRGGRRPGHAQVQGRTPTTRSPPTPTRTTCTR